MAGGGFSKQNSNSQSYSGLQGTPYAGQAAGQAYNSALQSQRVGNEMAQNPYNAQGQTQYMGQSGQSLLPSGQYGLGSNADMAMQQLGRQMFGFSSADGARRGQLSPENQGAVVGSAITAALPQVLPQIQNWQQAQFQAPMQVGQNALQGAQAPADQWARLLGSQASSSGSGFGFNVFGGK